VGSIDRRIQRLEERYGMPSPLDEEARRRHAQEVLDELKARLQRIAEQSDHAPDLTPEEDEDNTVRAFYQEVFGIEAGDEEWQAREALRKKYGAVSLAPPSEQQKLRRF
jgi:predicted transcriptional regulator